MGESSTLSWTSTNAETCEIDQGTGIVDLSGSMAVSPTETTTYTITASGPGGTATDTVTVTVLYPTTVSISADPETIQVGGSSTLTWTSANADSCVIEPGIGTIDPYGSMPVSPTETTTYTITATGLGGTATASVTVTISPIAISITSPLDGETISRPDALVQGAIINATGNETGVNVNGIVAMVFGNQFVANHIPLEEGGNTITATATDTDGNTITTSITIHALTTGDYIRITADTESGISPLETTLRIDGSFSFTESSLSYTGPGEVEFLESTSEEYRVRMTTEGIYYFTVEVTDSQSIAYTDTVSLVVINQEELDTLLRAKWDGMKAALSNGDIGEATNYIAEGVREMYDSNFNLMSSHLANISASLQDIESVRIKDGVAEYVMWAEQEGQTYSFYILFVKDSDGIWRIQFF